MPSLDPESMSPRELYFLMISSIVPRPIAFVSTISREGVLNCAPFSFFTGVCSVPPILAISVGNRRDGTPKDTAANILATGEFVVNVVTEDLAEPCVQASADVPPEVDEFTLAGLHPLASELVRPPRIQESPVQMECRLERALEIGKGPQHFILGEVVRFHVDDALWRDGEVDIAALRPVGRLGGKLYANVRDPFPIDLPPRS